MSELFYRTVRVIGGADLSHRLGSQDSSRRTRPARAGAYLLASNHTCAYDAPLLIAATPRVIYWLSVVELFQNPFSRWFLSSFGAMPLDRGKVDTVTVRQVARIAQSGTGRRDISGRWSAAR